MALLGGRSVRVLTAPAMTQRGGVSGSSRVPKTVMKHVVKKECLSLRMPSQTARQTQPKAMKVLVSSMKMKVEPPSPRRSIRRLPVQEENVGKRARMNQLTALEARSVSVEVQHQYRTYFEKFKDFCTVNAIVWPPSNEDADALMADYLDCLFLEGKTASEGEKTVAALEFHELKFKHHMPRSRRALKGWRKAVPPQSRLPLPRLAMFGIAMQMLANNLKAMALMTIISFDLYLRPGEALDIRKRNVVPPVKSAGKQFQWVTVVIRDQEGQRPDKVGVFDNSLALNNKHTMWIGRFLLEHVKTLKKDSFIFSFSMDEYRKQFVKFGAALGLGTVHPYQLRHGGATEDLTSGRLDHNGVKARGRWRTDQSVRRYAKSGRVQQLLSQMSAHQIQFCKWAETNMPKVFAGMVSARTLNI